MNGFVIFFAFFRIETIVVIADIIELNFPVDSDTAIHIYSFFNVVLMVLTNVYFEERDRKENMLSEY